MNPEWKSLKVCHFGYAFFSVLSLIHKHELHFVLVYFFPSCLDWVCVCWVSVRPIKRVKRGVNLKLTHTCAQAGTAHTHTVTGTHTRRQFMNLKNSLRCPKLIFLTSLLFFFSFLQARIYTVTPQELVLSVVPLLLIFGVFFWLKGIREKHTKSQSLGELADIKNTIFERKKKLSYIYRRKCIIDSLKTCNIAW